MYNISFISEEDLTKHVKETIKKYGEKLQPYDIKLFNKNIVDPIKMLFDKNVFEFTWEQIIKNEIFRQRDKSNNNDIGYFHQNIFNYIKDCTVPESGWDIIFKPESRIILSDGSKVSAAFVELKNKHNTMNSSSSAKTYMKMQHKLLKNDDCVCLLVEVIAKRSQNINWQITLDGTKQSHKLIRRVSIDKFYELVTGECDAFYNLCKILPKIIEKVVKASDEVITPHDTVYEELEKIAYDKDIPFALAMYMLGFSNYQGFSDYL